MKKIYLAKPDDGTELLTEEESRFLHAMNFKTPRNNFISISNTNINTVYEQIPDGMSQYFFYNGVEMDYVYPLEDKIIFLSKIDFSVPILQPFTYTKFQRSLLSFDKIIFLEDFTAEHIIKREKLNDFVDKFYVLDRYDGVRKPFLEYGETKPANFVKYYSLANKLIDAVKIDDFSKLKYEL
jgi:hypothetical protein